jgi:dolichol-phosphate mannosyltransferase
MYATARETWRAWPRSLNMRDATRPIWRWLDAVVLLLAQALPLPLVVLLALATLGRAHWPNAGLTALAAVNGALLLVRLLLLGGTAGSFARRGAPFWLSPLADPAAALRVVATTFTRSREWRGTAAARPPAIHISADAGSR